MHPSAEPALRLEVGRKGDMVEVAPGVQRLRDAEGFSLAMVLGNAMVRASHVFIVGRDRCWAVLGMFQAALCTDLAKRRMVRMKYRTLLLVCAVCLLAGCDDKHRPTGPVPKAALYAQTAHA